MNEIILDEMTKSELIAYIDVLEDLISYQYAVIRAHEQTEEHYYSLLNDIRYSEGQRGELLSRYRYKTDYTTKMIAKYGRSVSEPADVEDEEPFDL